LTIATTSVDAEARARRCVGVGRERQRQRLAAAEVPDDAVVHATVQPERAVLADVRVGRDVDVLLDVGRADHQATVGARHDRRIGVQVDRRVQHVAAVLVAVGRHVGAPSGQSEPQGRPCAHARAGRVEELRVRHRW
jgi:ribosomal protein L13E